MRVSKNDAVLYLQVQDISRRIIKLLVAEAVE